MLINRRGYPDSDPYTPEERSGLFCETKTFSVVNADLQKWMDDRAQEIHEFLCLYIRNERIPPYVELESSGGIIITGWSFGAAFVLGFVANIKRYSFLLCDGIDIRAFLRYTVLYGLF